MKTLVRASILTVAAAGLIAGFAPHHSAQVQAQALSHQVTSQVILPPTMCTPNNVCTQHGPW